MSIKVKKETERWHTRWLISGQLSWTPLARGHLLAVAGGMWQGEGWALRAVALLQLVLAGLFSSVGLGSESPDRECCDSLYPFIPIPEVATPKDYFDPYITESPNWNPPPVIDVTQEQQPIVTPRWLQPPEEPDSNWLFSTPRTTKKKKKTTKATTIRSGISYKPVWRKKFNIVLQNLWNENASFLLWNNMTREFRIQNSQ